MTTLEIMLADDTPVATIAEATCVPRVGVALKKLSLVSHALAQKIGGSAGQEQKTLATVLDDTIRKIELGHAMRSRAEDVAK